MDGTFDNEGGEEAGSNPASDDAKAEGKPGESAAPALSSSYPGAIEGSESAVRNVSPQPIVRQAPAANVPATNGMATAGGVVGIVGLVLSLIPIVGIFIGFVMGILAIIFGGVGLARYNKTGAGSKGLAITGVVLGIITVVLKLIPGISLL